MLDTLPVPAPGDSPALIDTPAPPTLATVITQDGRPVRLRPEGQRTVTLVLPGRLQPLRFDRYQAAALHQALGDALASLDGYLFSRGRCQ